MIVEVSDEEFERLVGDFLFRNNEVLERHEDRPSLRARAEAKFRWRERGQRSPHLAPFKVSGDSEALHVCESVCI